MKSRPLVAGLLGLATLGPFLIPRAEPTDAHTQTQTVTLPGGGTASVTVTTSGGGVPVISVSGAAGADDRPRSPGRKVPFLGVAALSVPEDVSAHLALPEGLYLSVASVQPGSPAAKAGLQPHDLLTHLDEQVLVNPPQFQRLVRMKKAGDEVTLRYLRAGKEQTVNVALVEQEIREEETSPRAWDSQSFPPAPPDMREHFRRMQEQMQRMHGRAGFPQIQDPFGQEENAVPSGGAQASSTSSRSASMVNDKGRFTFTEQNGDKTFRAESPDGKVLFEGPVNTEDERKKVPEDVREVLRELDGGTPGVRMPGHKARRTPRGEGI